MMNISRAKNKSGAGFALLAMLMSLVIILIVFASVMYWISTNSKQMKENQQYIASEAAAEGVTENIFAHMDRDYLYGNLDTSNDYDLDIPATTNIWPVAYSFDASVAIGPQSDVLNYLGSSYTNLLGEPQINTITVTATPLNQRFNVPATVSQTFVFATIPAFQFAIFYNINLEVDPGAIMPITGAVFSNGSIWSGTPNVTYSSTVEAAGQVNTTDTDPFCTGKNGTGGTPQSNFTYGGTPAQPESNVNPLIIPIGATGNSGDASTNVNAIIQVPPASIAAPQAVAYEQTNQVYDFNAASLIVSNWFWGSNGVASWSNNFTVYVQDSYPTPSMTQNGATTHWVELTNDFYIVQNKLGASAPTTFSTNYVPNFQFTNNVSSIHWVNPPTAYGPLGTNTVLYAGFSFLTNVTFYDFREQATVQAVQLDVGNFAAWITNSLPNGGSNWNQALCQDNNQGINSVFIDNTVPFYGQQQLPAVRVVDGQLLPSSTCTVNGHSVFTSGLTVVTPQPMYVEGNYNVQVSGGSPVLGSSSVVNTYPAAFLADSITILSSNWNDGWNSGTALSSRTPDPTTINAACLEGIVQSTNSNYSGGVENFLRMEENWGNGAVILTYNGSIMVMFPSEYATNAWPDTGTVYNPPQRNWSFDTNFLIKADLPPLTPSFRAVIRNSWSGY